MVFPTAHATISTMKPRSTFHNRIVAALFPIFLGVASFPAAAEGVEDLLTQLQTADPQSAGRLERKIWREWSKSGSPAFDLLLQRGRDALDAGDTDAAIEHLTALIDHALTATETKASS